MNSRSKRRPWAHAQSQAFLPGMGYEELFDEGYMLSTTADGIRIRVTDYHAGELDLSWDMLLELKADAH